MQTVNPEAYDTLWQKLDREGLFGSADEKIAYYLTVQQRQQQLLRTLNAVCACLQAVQSYPVSDAVQKWVGCLEKIISDELRLTRDETSQIIDATFLSKQKRGSYAIFSATDIDAIIRNHGPGKQDPGYNGSVAATVDFIREIRTDTGSQPDHVAIPALLQAQIKAHDVCPEKFIYDQAAGTGKTAADVKEATGGRTQLVANPKPANKKNPHKFEPLDFIVSEDKLKLTCLGGRSTIRRYRSGSGDGYTYRFAAAQCAGCVLLAACRGQKKATAPPTKPRNVFISDYRMERENLVAYSKTDAFKEEMRLRPHIERVISGLVLHNGARRARFRGLKKVDYQLTVQTNRTNELT